MTFKFTKSASFYHCSSDDYGTYEMRMCSNGLIAAEFIQEGNEPQNIKITVYRSCPKDKQFKRLLFRFDGKGWVVSFGVNNRLHFALLAEMNTLIYEIHPHARLRKEFCVWVKVEAIDFA